MPLYICNTKKNALDGPAKERIAQGITRIHCEVTGAPASFVHAVFFEEADQFPLEDKTLFVRGSIRKGRSDQQKEQIAESIRQMLATSVGVGVEQADARILETPAAWVMEGGEIMPEPGEEAEWFAAHERRRATE